MIVDIGNRGALSLDADDVTAAYECGEVLSDATGSELPGTASRHRLILELQRNFGGIPPASSAGCGIRRRRYGNTLRDLCDAGAVRLGTGRNV